MNSGASVIFSLIIKPDSPHLIVLLVKSMLFIMSESTSVNNEPSLDFRSTSDYAAYIYSISYPITYLVIGVHAE